MADKNNQFIQNIEQFVGTFAIYFTTVAFFIFATRGNIYNPNRNHLPSDISAKSGHAGPGEVIDEYMFKHEVRPSLEEDTTPSTPTKNLVQTKHLNPQADGKSNIFMSPISSNSYIVEPLLGKISSTAVDDVIVIGIAGGSGSGKTTLSEAIYAEIGKENICFISHDSYYRDLNHLTMAERENFNFDHPDALETDLLVHHVQELKMKRNVEIPKYDFTIHSRKAETQSLSPRPVILVEGILIFSDQRLINELDIKVFVDTEDDIRLVRRIRRDTVERGRTVDSVLQQYITHVRPMHLQFVEPSKRNADIIVPVGLNSVALDLVVSKLKSHLNVHS